MTIICALLVRKIQVVRTLATIAFLIASAHQASAAVVTATWDRNPETNVTGYVLSYGIQSRVYSTNIDVGNVISHQLNLAAGQRYYFAVRAYNVHGQFSGYSAEVFADIVGPAAPVITSLSPTSGIIGAPVTISGSGFGTTKGTSTVRFNGTTAATTSWSESSIVASVPAGATSGSVVVTVNGVASNGMSFAVGAPLAPSITSLSPTSGIVGTSVIIAGANFGSTQGTSSIRFNGTLATPTSWSATSVVATVPNGATSGPVVVTVNGVASNGATFTITAPATPPAPWLTQDIGNPAVTGQAAHAAGTFTVSGGGVDIWNTADQFRFVYQPLNGNGEIVARVGSLQNTDSWAKAGVMIREDLAGDSPHAMAIVTVSNGLALQSRPTRGAGSATNGIPGAAPQWIRLVRAGNTFTGYYSANGAPWTLISSTTVTMPAQAYVGLAVTSHNPSVATTATFTNVTVTGSAPPNQAPILTQPASQTSAEGTSPSLQLAATDPDGNPLTYSATGLPASLGVNPATGLISGTLTFTSSGTYSVTATASDGPLSNSKTFTWTVTDVVQAPAPTITSLSPLSGAIGTSVTIAGANFGTATGTSTVRFNGTTATTTSWSATSMVAAVPSGASTGPVVVTVNGVASNGAAFTVTTPSPLPAPWLTQDIGSPTVTGQAAHAAGTFTVSGGGVDIWNSADQFRFVYQPLNGNGEIVARVSSLQNTDAWAKAGVMIRQNLTAGSRHAMVVLTPGNGMAMQRRRTPGGESTHTGASSGSGWTRLVRSGNTFRGYYSVNGASWTLIDTVTVAMPNQVYVGLAVTSHNPSVTATATFTNVTVTGSSSLTTQMPTTTGSSNQLVSASTGSTTSDQAATGQEGAFLPRASGLSANDYDGDGKADLAAYRPSTGDWQILSSLTGYQTGGAGRWGSSTDLPVPGDYDGDRRTDLAYYQPSTGRWSISTSSTNDTTGLDVVLGAKGDVPVPGDYDGDARTDIAVYSPSTGLWRILKSTANYATEIVSLWGQPADVPVPEDYDGDGKTDPAVYRPSTGEWRVQQSSSDYATNVTTVLGASADIPVPADYDGDGLADAATFAPSTGRWRTRSSSTSVTRTIATLGAQTDVPLPADYDGDGRADLSVFHSGSWRALYSSMGYASGIEVSWAAATDVPLPRRP